MAARALAMGGPKKPDDGTTPPWPSPAAVTLNPSN